MPLISLELEFIERSCTAKQSNATTRNNSFFDGGSCCSQRIIDEIFAFLHFRFGVGTNTNLSNSTSQLCQSFLKFFAIVLAICFRDFLSNHRHTTVNISLLTSPLNDSRVLGINTNFFSYTKISELDTFELDAQVLENSLRIGQDGNIFQHRLAAVSVTWSLDRTDLQNPSHLINNESGQRLTLDILGNNQQREAGLRRFFEQWNQRLGTANLIFVNQNPTIIELDNLIVDIGDEMRRQISSLKLHPLHQLNLSGNLTTFLNGNHPILTNLQQGVSKYFSNFLIIITSNRGHSLNSFAIVSPDRLCQLLQFSDHGINRFLHTTTESHRITAAGDITQTVTKNRLCQNRSGRRPVTGNVTRLRSCFLNKLHTHILIFIFEINILRNSHPILRDFGRPPTLIEDGIPTTRTERAFHSPRQLGHTFKQTLPSLIIKTNQLRHSDSSSIRPGVVG